MYIVLLSRDMNVAYIRYTVILFSLFVLVNRHGKISGEIESKIYILDCISMLFMYETVRNCIFLVLHEYVMCAIVLPNLNYKSFIGYTSRLSSERPVFDSRSWLLHIVSFIIMADVLT